MDLKPQELIEGVVQPMRRAKGPHALQMCLDQRRFTDAGCADSRRSVPNDTPEGRIGNRGAELVEQSLSGNTRHDRNAVRGDTPGARPAERTDAPLQSEADEVY